MKYDNLENRERTTITRAIIFDFGNVLLEWNPRHAYRRYLPGDQEAMEKAGTRLSVKCLCVEYPASVEKEPL